MKHNSKMYILSILNQFHFNHNLHITNNNKKIDSINFSSLEYIKCCICCLDYKNSDIISSCSNELKHHYHEKCLLQSFKISKEFCHNPVTYTNQCPYCRKIINKKYNKFKIIKKETI